MKNELLKKAVAVTVMALMLVMNFAGVPGVFAEADNADDQNVEGVYSEPYDDEYLAEVEDEDADELYAQFAAES